MTREKAPQSEQHATGRTSAGDDRDRSALLRAALTELRDAQTVLKPLVAFAFDPDARPRFTPAAERQRMIGEVDRAMQGLETVGATLEQALASVSRPDHRSAAERVGQPREKRNETTTPTTGAEIRDKTDRFAGAPREGRMSMSLKEQIDTYAANFAELNAYSQADWNVLRQNASTIRPWVPDLVKVFYDRVFSSSPTSALVEQGDRDRLASTLSKWMEGILSGDYDELTWTNQYVIGLRHIIRGVKNLYFLGMMSCMQAEFLSRCLSTMNPDQAQTVYLAFHRVTSVIGGIVAECYTDGYINCLARVGMRESVVSNVAKAEAEKMITQLRS
ncbi:MAG: hypothetical protein KC609_07215 [Myxococcales bacterium]|nr:hypothetical protein [Myxococcales bacterium]